jgi:putative ABC transport system permease protein
MFRREPGSSPEARHRYRRFLRRDVKAELDDELRFHFDLCIADLVARGLSPAAARERVLARLGDVDAARAQCLEIDHRQQRKEARVERLETVLQDLKLIVRSLSRQKSWTVVVITTLALGIGATSALFTITNAVLLRPLPYAHPDRIISISEASDGSDREVVPGPIFEAWRRSTRSFTAIAAYGGTSTVLQGSAGPEIVRGLSVTQSYFSILGIAPVRGRVFTPDEDLPGAPKSVILSDQIWRRIYNADPAIVGKPVSLDGDPATVVGVMPASFTSSSRAQYWVPFQLARSGDSRNTFYYYLIGRLRDGISFETARAELLAIARRANAPRGPEWLKATPVLMTLHDRRYGDSRTALYILLGAVGVLLLIACANVSNLLLARASRRRREFAVRVALGASTWRLFRYLLSESLLLAIIGGALGLLIAVGSVGYFVHISPETIARADNIRVDWTVVAFTSALAILTGIVFGLVPASAIWRSDVNGMLTKGSDRTGHTREQHAWRRALVVGELATALVLLTAAGLLTKSFARVTSIDAGIQPDRLLLGEVRLSYRRYDDSASLAFYTTFLDRVSHLPGVESAAMADAPPLGRSRMSMTITRDGKKSPLIDVGAVTDGYFKTLDIPVVQGRSLLPGDRPGSAPVGVINQTMARAMFPGVNPLGQRLVMRGSKGVLIVGVIRDVMQRGVEAEVTPMIYLAAAQDETNAYMHLIVRAKGKPEALIAPIRNVFRSLAPDQPAPTFATMRQTMLDSVAPRRFSFVLLAIFAVLAAALASIGLYGVMSYLVAERTTEIGIRVALGADRPRVIRYVVGEGMLLGTIGLVLGFAGSVAAVRLLRNMLFRVSIYDPWIFLASAGLLGAVTLIACSLPAIRAARVDPIQALRA